MLSQVLAPDRWAEFRWLASADERVLWATLAAALLMGLWGAFVGWRSRDQTSG
ncbi:MAG: hypothetical protein R6X02_33600 [Enhygromyxa sp.]